MLQTWSEIWGWISFQSGPPQFHTPLPLSSTQCVIISTQKGHFFSAPKTSQFHTENPSVPHQKALSSTSVVLNWEVFGVELRGFLVWNWGVFGVEPRGFGVELRGFWCWTEGFWALKRCGLCVEPMCWTEGVYVELRGTPFSQFIERLRMISGLNILKSDHPETREINSNLSVDW